MKYINFCILIILIFLFSQHLFASCGAASCPLNSFRYTRAGLFTLGYSYEYINQDQIYVGSTKSFVGAIPEDHDEVQTINERSSLNLQYGLLDNVGMALTLPFMHRQHFHIGHEDTAASVWEAWNFSGLGDMRIDMQYAVFSPSKEFEPYFGVTAGVKLPTGVTGLKNAGGEEAEVTIQPGTGSWDGILGLQYRQTIVSIPTLTGAYGALPLIAGISYQVNGKGTYDYRFGNTLLVHVGSAYQFVQRAGFLLQVNGRFQDYADAGTTGEPRENTGGTWIYLSPGLNLQISDGLEGSAYVQVPVYQEVHGIQQTAKFNLAFNISYSFDLKESE